MCIHMVYASTTWRQSPCMWGKVQDNIHIPIRDTWWLTFLLWNVNKICMACAYAIHPSWKRHGRLLGSGCCEIKVNPGSFQINGLFFQPSHLVTVSTICIIVSVLELFPSKLFKITTCFAHIHTSSMVIFLSTGQFLVLCWMLSYIHTHIHMCVYIYIYMYSISTNILD